MGRKHSCQWRIHPPETNSLAIHLRLFQWKVYQSSLPHSFCCSYKMGPFVLLCPLISQRCKDTRWYNVDTVFVFLAFRTVNLQCFKRREMILFTCFSISPVFIWVVIYEKTWIIIKHFSFLILKNGGIEKKTCFHTAIQGFYWKSSNPIGSLSQGGWWICNSNQAGWIW